jgi:hypothetical protein
MSSNIQEFISSLAYDFARPSRFDVILTVPLAFSKGLPGSSTLAFRCEATTLPGRTIATQDLTVYGPSEKYPYQTTYNDISMTFLCSDDMSEKALFDVWLDYINPTVTHDFSYKSDYVSQIVIEQYNVGANPSYQVVLQDAFPIAVSEMELNWGSDGIHKITVDFAYTLWNSFTLGYDLGQANIPSPQTPTNVQDITKNKNNRNILGTVLSLASLATSAKKALTSSNPYAGLSVLGAGSSLLPNLGVNGTLSSVIGGKPQGIGNISTYGSQISSVVNGSKNTIGSTGSSIGSLGSLGNSGSTSPSSINPSVVNLGSFV